ncbi:TRAP transporter substrate-binding protein DctP [Paracoccus sp. J39]|uniref:TRAP transporter substrate-binding protein n=1 Tax=Paracoccus sp. J39 TaxID=935848 RepID=UPI0004B27E1D|nr:TRAP transporter substrate-binding protein DctP [Paracoccus sp. J39]
MKEFRGIVSVLGLGAAMAVPMQAVAQDTHSFKFAHVFPADHYFWEHGAKPFVEQVKEKTGGRISFEVFPAAQLGKDTVSLLKSGIAESAMLVPSYTPQSLPLTSVTELPGFYSESCEATRMMWEISKPGGALNESEYKPQGIHVLFTIVLPPFKVMTVGKQVKELDDMKGLKIRANGAAMDKTVSSLGATPIRVTAGELYDSLSRGTVDGGFWPYHSVRTYQLDDVFKYAVDGLQLGSGSTVFAISDKAWNTLSPEDQAILTEAGAAAQQNLCQWLDTEEKAVHDDLVANHGLSVTTLEGAAAKDWQDRVSHVAEEWAAELDKLNRPGTAMLEAFAATKSQ